jgi:SAM-dependent methyltransferase
VSSHEAKGRHCAPYARSLEFYDLLQQETDRRRAERWFTASAAEARLGVLDAGAGTGAVTEVLLHATGAPVYAVEPSPAMRSGLLSRLARLGADKRARVTVLSEPIAQVGLREIVDLAVAANVVAVLPPPERRAAWRVLAAALVRDGLLLFDPPPAQAPDPNERRLLGPVQIGPDTYSAEAVYSPDRGRIQARFRYRVERDGQMLREEHESFAMWPVTADTLRNELEEADFTITEPPADGLVAARRT